jgi:hypothetical protein
LLLYSLATVKPLFLHLISASLSWLREYRTAEVLLVIHEKENMVEVFLALFFGDVLWTELMYWVGPLTLNDMSFSITTQQKAASRSAEQQSKQRLSPWESHPDGSGFRIPAVFGRIYVQTINTAQLLPLGNLGWSSCQYMMYSSPPFFFI